jgi:alkylation response protein AidB-like acyl-CoA dehydrogenase
MTNSSMKTSLDSRQVTHNITEIVADWAGQRSERQRRRGLDRADFDRLREAGYPLACLPTEYGGLWERHDRSSRLVFDLLRVLAHGDSSVALVAAMHPGVLAAGGWLGSPSAPAPWSEAWEAQRSWVFQTVRDGAWWGTMISEPGSGGDSSLTRAVARPEGDAAGNDQLRYRLTGQKQFGSGSGITSYMITRAIPVGEAKPDVFFLDLRDVPWDGSTGLKLLTAWDGHGMTATQSHAMELNEFPATRLAWPSESQQAVTADRPIGGGFVSVIVGIVEVAVETARRQLQARRAALRPYEQVEWSRVELEFWLIEQAYQGMLRAIEQRDQAARSSRLAKASIAELAESVLGRVCRVVGGGAYSRHSPFGFWLEDVRALGFLRPPWGLAFDQLFAGSWAATET